MCRPMIPSTVDPKNMEILGAIIDKIDARKNG